MVVEDSHVTKIKGQNTYFSRTVSEVVWLERACTFSLPTTPYTIIDADVSFTFERSQEQSAKACQSLNSREKIKLFRIVWRAKDNLFPRGK